MSVWIYIVNEAFFSRSVTLVFIPEQSDIIHCYFERSESTESLIKTMN